MQSNPVLDKLRRGEATLGSFVGLGSPNVVELLGHAGMDWLILETEHNGLDAAEVEHLLRAASGTQAVPIVRVPSSDHVYIQRALDLGAMGVMVPLVRTVSEVETIVRATRYPPDGTRSFGPLRASHYGLDNADYLAHANSSMLVALIVETREALERIDAIAAVPGVNVLYMGLFDLCLSLGLNPLDMPLPAIDAAIERVLDAGRRYGVAVGHGASTPAGIGALRSQGFSFIGYGPDYALLTGAARAGVEAFRQSTGVTVR
jgi:2-keto-3-deoxy-L-rhamnonate aldolase RhmA